jgi:phosphoesterase RecJ-like protein
VPETSAPATAATVAAALAPASSVVLLAHINPDADSLGGALALGLALERRGVDVTVGFDRPGETPESLRELPGQQLISSELPMSPDVVVTVDVAGAARLGDLRGLLDTAGLSIVIDHHASNPGFGRLNWIDPSAEAAVLLIAELIDELGVEITPDIATNLYAGLATDTANFRFATERAHQLAARLMETGIRPEEILRPIVDTHPFRWLGMLATVMSRARLDRDAAGGAGLVTVPITLEDSAAVRQEELDSVIDIARTAEEAEVTAVLKQSGEEVWQVSLRSRNGLDIGRLATLLGGGGHPRAAGYTYHGRLDGLLTQLHAALATAAPARG